MQGEVQGTKSSIGLLDPGQGNSLDAIFGTETSPNEGHTGTVAPSSHDGVPHSRHIVAGLQHGIKG